MQQGKLHLSCVRRLRHPSQADGDEVQLLWCQGWCASGYKVSKCRRWKKMRVLTYLQPCLSAAYADMVH